MGPLKIKTEPGPDGRDGVWVEFDVDGHATFVPRDNWVGVDLDGTLSRTDNPGHFDPPYPLGDPILPMLEMVKSLLAAGVIVKIFTARACEPDRIPGVQDWAERHGLGRLEVTNQKDFALIRFYDDRAVQICPNHGVSVTAALRSPSPAKFKAPPEPSYNWPNGQ